MEGISMKNKYHIFVTKEGIDLIRAFESDSGWLGWYDIELDEKLVEEYKEAVRRVKEIEKEIKNGEENENNEKSTT